MFYVKFYCEEGVVDWYEVKTEQEAELLKQFAINIMQETDPDQDFYSVTYDKIKPKDEGGEVCGNY